MAQIIDRLYRVWLLGLCIVQAAFRGKADVVPTAPSRVVVVLTGKLGDVVCGTPVLRALKARYPVIHIAVAGTTKIQKPVLDDSGLVDEYLDLDASGAIARIRKGNFEAAFVTGPSFTTVAKLYLAHIPLVVVPRVENGFSPGETKLYRVLKKIVVTYPYRMGEYAPMERLKSIESIGIYTRDTDKKLGFSYEASKKVESYLKEHGLDNEFLVGVSPSAGHKIKEWPEERFSEVVNHLVEKYQVKVILIGGPDDKEKVDKVLQGIREKHRVVNTQGLLNVDELKALVSKLGLFISVDTGPIYIAEAFNVPTVDITGPIDENEQPPRGIMHVNVIPKDRRRPELYVLNARSYNREEALRQLNSISVEQVNEAVDSLMKKIKHGGTK